MITDYIFTVSQTLSAAWNVLQNKKLKVNRNNVKISTRSRLFRGDFIFCIYSCSCFYVHLLSAQAALMSSPTKRREITLFLVWQNSLTTSPTVLLLWGVWPCHLGLCSAIDETDNVSFYGTCIEIHFDTSTDPPTLFIYCEELNVTMIRRPISPLLWPCLWY